MNIIKTYQEVIDFVNKNNLAGETNAALVASQLGNIKELQKTLEENEEYADEGRLLRIGIIGRVKAGKSSLLNTLIFDGEDILPKAATPMTAALTVMKYSESISAEIDFFDQEDRKTIKKEHDEYFKALKQLAHKKLEELQSKQQKKFIPNLKAKPINTEEVREKAEKSARKELERDMPRQAASYDQYLRMQDYVFNLDQIDNELNQYRHITATTVEALTTKLQEFVGANGRYMPFTKSVTLNIPNENLKELEIIDTPGLNDPIQSRSRRTEDMLQKCDVILIVSPAGQFLSSDDVDLLGRIVSKEGVQEIHLIASQTDNQLFGSIAREHNNPREALESISKQLTVRARGIIQEEINKHPENIQAYKKMLEHDVICTSSVAYTLNKYFSKTDLWDSNAQTVWGNLHKHYPTSFESASVAQSALQQLANIDSIYDVLKKVKQQKQHIIKEKIDALKSQKAQALLGYIEEIKKHIDNKILELNNTSVEKLKKQLDYQKNQSITIKNAVNDCYDDLLFDLQNSLNSTLRDKLSLILNTLNREVNNEYRTEVEHYTVTIESPWWKFWESDSYEQRSRTVEKIYAGIVRVSIENTRKLIEETLKESAVKIRHDWNKTLKKEIIEVLRGEHHENDEYININKVDGNLKFIISTIPEKDFILKDSLPKEIDKSGTLKGYEVQEFIDNVRTYAKKLEGDVRTEIIRYVEKDTINPLKKKDIGSELTKEIQSSIQKTIDEVKNLEKSLYRYEAMQKQINKIKQGV